ncbi:dihydromonapterin reductase [uncultured Amphritea sp.]|uniref:dihydromonapterin reductase n=1 Tax=uncultured Amphritea sp. TaxID=981605 RepID=UPI00262D9729|nr:dihydromonapterin reductase [uncultured Amphritea sp.]
MVNRSSAPILITGVGKRIGFALCKHFLQQGRDVIGTYRSHYDALDELEGARLIRADFTIQADIDHLVEVIKREYPQLRAIIHNASDWLAESEEIPAAETFQRMMQIHAAVPYQLNLALKDLLNGRAGDIIHLTDYVAEKGSRKHIAYAASKAALANMTLSFSALLAPRVKVNAIAPSLIMFNEDDSAEYRQKALEKSLMKVAPGEQEVIEAVVYLLKSHYITGRTLSLDGGRHLN